MRRHARIPAGLLEGVPPGPTKVLLAIAEHVNTHTSTAVLTQQTLTASTGYTERQLRRNLRVLEDLGLLHITRGNGRGRPTEYLCPWHLFTVGKSALFTPGDNPERRTSMTAFIDEKADIHVRERRTFMSGPISTTVKENNARARDRRSCMHGVLFGDRLDGHGVSTGGCLACEQAQRHVSNG